MNADVLIELEGIGRRYRGRGGVPVTALRDVSLRIYPGEFVCITGPSGSGKSTLMHILGCLDRPQSGSYRLAGREVSKLAAEGLVWLRRHVFGFVFQSYNLLAYVTAVENVEIPGFYAGLTRQARRRRALGLLGALGLGARVGHRPGALSGGEQQRVAIARALMNGGRVILADEPTGALDSRSGNEVLHMLEDLVGRGHTVVMVSHNPDVAARAGRRIELLDGRVVADTGARAGPAASTPALPSRPAVPRPGAARRALDALRDGMASLRTILLGTRRMRAALTVFCIVLGIWSVSTMLTIAEGTYRQTVDLAYRFGGDRFGVWPPEDGTAGALTVDDAAAIAAQVPNVRLVVPAYSRRMSVRHGARDMPAMVESLVPRESGPPNGSEFRNLARGASIGVRDNDNRAQVAVIGWGIERDLFPRGTDAVGQLLLIGNVPFTVKGVLAPPDAGQRDRNVVLIPFRTGAALLHGTDNPQWLTVSVEDVRMIERTLAAVRELMIRRHAGAGIRIDFNPAYAEQARETRGEAWLGFGALGGIALLVGGMGVMGIMLMSVNERTREIGIRMAIGARSGDITRQFVVEAAALTTMGGVLGMIAALATTPLMRLLDLPAVFAPSIALAALAVSTATGLVFGIVPARRAAALDPVTALRATV